MRCLRVSLILFNRKIQNATPFDFDGIHFRSKFECDVYKALKKNGFQPLYEAEKVILFNGFRPQRCWYQDGIPMITKKSRVPIKLTDWIYTPDFTLYIDDYTIYIEAKGFPNDVYTYKRKLFLKHIDDKKALFFEVKNMKGLNQTINLLKDVRHLIENQEQQQKTS